MRGKRCRTDGLLSSDPLHSPFQSLDELMATPWRNPAR
jgi:hypothetical protein